MSTFRHCQLNLIKKIPYLLIISFCLTFLSACDSSNNTSNTSSIDSPSETKEDPKEETKEKIGIVRCAP